jgi:hypothetical protein
MCCPRTAPDDYAQLQCYDRFSSQRPKFSFFPYFCGFAFNPQVVHFLKFYNWLYIMSAFIPHVHALLSYEF